MKAPSSLLRSDQFRGDTRTPRLLWAGDRSSLPGMQRKTVTVLFCDVTGSTALGESVDPETLRGLLARYFERRKAIVDGVGARVEKFVADHATAVSGGPVGRGR